MPRLGLTDKQWLKLLQVMMNTGRIYNKSEHRMTFEEFIIACEYEFHCVSYQQSLGSGALFIVALTCGRRKVC